jgi:hypothetical protein
MIVFATYNLTKFAASPWARSDKSTTILAGHYRERQSSVWMSWLQATPRGNLGIIDIIYRNLVLPRRKFLEPSGRIVSGLALRSLVVTISGHHLENPRSRRHKGVSALPHLPETMVKLAGDRIVGPQRIRQELLQVA